jgi:hypothetical protein
MGPISKSNISGYALSIRRQDCSLAWIDTGHSFADVRLYVPAP